MSGGEVGLFERIAQGGGGRLCLITQVLKATCLEASSSGPTFFSSKRYGRLHATTMPNLSTSPCKAIIHW